MSHQPLKLLEFIKLIFNNLKPSFISLASERVRSIRGSGRDTPRESQTDGERREACVFRFLSRYGNNYNSSYFIYLFNYTNYSNLFFNSVPT